LHPHFWVGTFGFGDGGLGRFVGYVFKIRFQGGEVFPKSLIKYPHGALANPAVFGIMFHF
jgi:hypothetical protein